MHPTRTSSVNRIARKHATHTMPLLPCLFLFISNTTRFFLKQKCSLINTLETFYILILRNFRTAIFFHFEVFWLGLFLCWVMLLIDYCNFNRFCSENGRWYKIDLNSFLWNFQGKWLCWDIFALGNFLDAEIWLLFSYFVVSSFILKLVQYAVL